MSAGAWMMTVALVLAFGSLLMLIFATVRSIQTHRSERGIWREFGLGLILMILFFVTWVGHGIAEWQVFTDEQREHGEETEVGDFVSTFAQSTLENWQSEFLQLFTMAIFTAFLIHRGSTESRDSDEETMLVLTDIQDRLARMEGKRS